MDKAIEVLIKYLAAKATRDGINADDALKYSQAVLNLANSKAVSMPTETN